MIQSRLLLISAVHLIVNIVLRMNSVSLYISASHWNFSAGKIPTYKIQTEYFKSNLVRKAKYRM